MTVSSRDLGILRISSAPVNGVDEVQQLSITGGPTGGTFTLTFDGQTTAAIPFNATALQVQTALRALASIGAAGVNCTGGPLPGTPIVITFAGDLSGKNVSQLTSTDSLTGGAVPATAISTTTPGVNGTYRGVPAGQHLVDEQNHKVYQNTGSRAKVVWEELPVS